MKGADSISCPNCSYPTWREAIQECTRLLLSYLSDEPDEVAVRSKVIRVARLALGDTPSGDLEVFDMPDPFMGDYPSVESLANILRHWLTAHHPRWSDPIQGESVMATILATVDKHLGRPVVPPAAGIQLARAARLSARHEYYSHRLHDSDAGKYALLEGVRDAVLTALTSRHPDEALFLRSEPGGPNDAAGAPPMMTTSGMFRLAMAGLDWGKVHVTESVLAIVGAAARDELATLEPELFTEGDE